MPVTPFALNRLGWLLAGVLALFVVASFAGIVRGGPLDPTGAPAPTLPQVEPRMPIRQPASVAAFPIVISSSGSYFLTQNITGGAGHNGILISASDVTIDLNGFTLSGADTGNEGIASTGAGNVTITNGTVRDWLGAGVSLAAVAGGRYERLQLIRNNGGGIIAGKSSTISECSAADNGGNGVAVVQPLTIGSSIVTRCTVDGSVLDGIQVDNNVTVTENTVTNNGADGIHAFNSGNRIEANNLNGNGGSEIHILGTGNVIARNSFRGGASDLVIPSGNPKGPTEDAGTPITNPWANISY